MAPTSAAVLFLAVAAALMAMASQLSAAAAAPAPWPAPIGLPNCNTTCGNVSVPYPFGFGPSRCYWPGLNLTCDTIHHPPRLLLGDDATLQVTEIFLRNATMRVISRGSTLNATGDAISKSLNASFGRGFMEHGYLLSSANEVVVSGCNVQATLLADIGEEATRIVASCASFCTRSDRDVYLDRARKATTTSRHHCSGTSGCCVAPLTHAGLPKEVQVKWLYKNEPFSVFMAEKGWVDRNGLLDSNGLEEVDGTPFVIGWNVTQGLPQRDECDDDVSRLLCKSEHSECLANRRGYTCRCQHGYDGNPYLPGGCQGQLFLRSKILLFSSGSNLSNFNSTAAYRLA